MCALVISDAHPGLVDAIGAALPGACWQRCRTHYARNLSSQVPKTAQPWVLTLLRTVFDQPDPEEVRAQFDRVVDTLEAKFPRAAAHLADAGDDLLAFTGFPREAWRQIWSNNPQERLNKEIRRRTDVVGIFPDRDSVIRLVGAVLLEQTDEWAEQRRYLGVEVLAKSNRGNNNDNRLRGGEHPNGNHRLTSPARITRQPPRTPRPWTWPAELLEAGRPRHR